MVCPRWVNMEIKEEIRTTDITFENNRLSYTGQDCENIPAHLLRLNERHVYTLDLSFNKLKNIDGLQKFSNLKELILDNNELGNNFKLPSLPQLEILSLNKNNIMNLDALLAKIVEKLPSLSFLSLLGNPACPDQLSDPDKDEDDYKRYRHYVIYRLPNLKFLDSSKISKGEHSEALERGQFMRLVCPETTKNSAEVGDSTNLRQGTWNPLPLSSRDFEDHTGAYGKCRYRYSGKHSEGNRFILNKDL